MANFLLVGQHQWTVQFCRLDCLKLTSLEMSLPLTEFSHCQIYLYFDKTWMAFFLGFVSWAKLPWLSLTCGWAAACQRQWGLLTVFVFSYHFIVAFCLWFRVLTMLQILSTFCVIRKGRASLPAKMGIPHRLDNKLNYLWKTAENVISRWICLGSICSRK